MVSILKTKQVSRAEVGWKEWLFGSPSKYIHSTSGGWLYSATYYLKSGWFGHRYILADWETCEGCGGWYQSVAKECPTFEDFENE